MARTPGQKKRITRSFLWRCGLFVCCVVCLLLFHLWEQAHVTQLDSRIRALQGEIDEVRIENSRLTVQVIALTEWGVLLERAETELSMTYPSIENLTLIEQSTHLTSSPDEHDPSGYERDR